MKWKPSLQMDKFPRRMDKIPSVSYRTTHDRERQFAPTLRDGRGLGKVLWARRTGGGGDRREGSAVVW